MKTEQPTIEIRPESALLNEQISVVFSGLKSDEKYRITAAQKDDEGVCWKSECVFTSDEAGRIDLTSSVPVSGGYQGVDPMGLFWSMEPHLSEKVMKQNFANRKLTPLICEISVFAQSKLLSTRIIERLRVSSSVERIPLAEEGLVGSLFLPGERALNGAAVYVTGSGGGHSEVHAAMLASHGIPTLSLAYFREEGLPDELREIPLEYFERAFGWLGNRDEVDSGKLAIVGASRGGELALLLGSRLKALKAVVGIVPSCFVHGSYGADPEDVCAAWTYGGQDLPYYSNKLGKAFRDRLVAAWKADGVKGCVDLLMSTPELKEVVIPVADINGPVLLVSGGADRIWSSAFLGDVVMEILETQGHRFSHKHQHCDGCGHFHPLGFLPTTVMSVNHPVGGKPVELGGEAKAVSEAGADAWAGVIDFLKHSLA